MRWFFLFWGAILFFPNLAFDQACVFNPVPFSGTLNTRNEAGFVRPRSPVIIPVVVHIVWRENHQNLTDEQILLQIESLNRDFRKLNQEWKYLPPGIEAADTGIEFCIFDPVSHQAQITRTQTLTKDIGLDNAIYYTTTGGQDSWDTNQYLNIWVCELPEAVLGYASAPWDNSALEDGVVINYRYFGITGHGSAQSLGRTLTHEIGHYLGLLHPWGLNPGDCDEDDLVTDTPFQSYAHAGCPQTGEVDCGAETNPWTFMDYTDDCCMALFTPGQKDRMLYFLFNFRPELIRQDCNFSSSPVQSHELTVFPNPSSGIIHFTWEFDFCEDSSIRFYNIAGAELASYPVNGLSHFRLCKPDWPDGIYLFFLTCAGRISAKTTFIYKNL